MATFERVFEHTVETFPPVEFPTGIDVMRVFFFLFWNVHDPQNKLTISESARKVGRDLRALWLNRNHATMSEQAVVDKINKVYVKFCSLKKDEKRNNGAFVLMEKKLGKPLIYLACRHHMLEVIPKNVFEKTVEASSSPDIGTLCMEFRQKWGTMDHTAFKAAVKDPLCSEILTEATVKEVLQHANDFLKVRVGNRRMEFYTLHVHSLPPTTLFFPETYDKV